MFYYNNNSFSLDLDRLNYITKMSKHIPCVTLYDLCVSWRPSIRRVTRSVSDVQCSVQLLHATLRSGAN